MLITNHKYCLSNSKGLDGLLVQVNTMARQKRSSNDVTDVESHDWGQEKLMIQLKFG